jgi:DNA gyrase subunit A
MAIIKAELQAIKEKHATPRLTEIVPDEGEIAIEDLIANEGVIITLTHNGLIKRTNVSPTARSAAAAKGVIGMTTREARRRRGRRFHRASLHRQHARLPDVLHEHGARVCRARA